MSIKNNTTSLQSVLEALSNKTAGENLDEEISAQETLISEQDAKIAELAEILSSKASVSYPTLSNPATAENLQEGYQLINGNGNVITGTHTCSGGSADTYTGTITTSRWTIVGTNHTIHYTDETLNHRTITVASGGDEKNITIAANTLMFIEDASSLTGSNIILNDISSSTCLPTANNFTIDIE